MAAAIATELAHGGDVRLAPDADPAEQDARIADLLEKAVRAGEESVRRRPELLPALREAGVVDAGGYGVVVLFAGCVAALRGTERARGRAPPRPGARHPPRARVLDVPLLHELRRHRRAGRRARGDAALRAPARAGRRLGARRRRPRDAAGPRPHRRAARPRRRSSTASARSRASTSPTCTRRSPSATAPGGRWRQAAGASAAAACWRSCPATGIASMFRDLGCEVLDGGATMNPSTYDILAGDPRRARRGGRRAPEQPQRLHGRPGAPPRCPRRPFASCLSAAQQAGLAAALALLARPRRGRERRAMEHALADVRTGAVAPAARADAQGRFAVGDAVGYVGDELVAWGEPAPDAARGARAARRRTPSSSRSSTVTARRSARPRSLALAPGRRRARVRARRPALALVAVVRRVRDDPPGAAAALRLRRDRAAERGAARRRAWSAPRPAPLREALRLHERQGARGRRDARHRDRRRPARAPPARPPRGARRRGALAGRAGDRRRRGPLDRLAPGAPARDAADRRGRRRRRDRADEGRVLQPAVARAPLPGGDAARPARHVRRPQPLPRHLARADGRGRRRRRPGRPLSGHRRALLDADPRARARAPAGARAWRSSRCPAGCALGTACRAAAALLAAHSGDLEAARRRLAFDELLLAQLDLLRRRAHRRGAVGAPVLAGPATGRRPG